MLCSVPAAGFGEVVLRPRYLSLENTATTPGPYPQLEPQPSNPAEALVDWLQVRRIRR